MGSILRETVTGSQRNDGAEHGVSMTNSPNGSRGGCVHFFQVTFTPPSTIALKQAALDVMSQPGKVRLEGDGNERLFCR
jgi:hypothetical protein